LSFTGVIERVVVDRRAIASRVAELAVEVAAYFGERPLTVVPVLAGALVFTSDLVRAMPLPMKIGLVGLSSYSGAATRPRELRVSFELDGDIANRSVLVVDDIIDTGETLSRACRIIRDAGAADVRSVVLLAKDRPREVDVRPDWVGFRIEDAFVVGYGLDYNDLYRNVPDVVVLKDALYRGGPGAGASPR
jgi:hypoxanthine phosphoribosyltransferase